MLDARFDNYKTWSFIARDIKSEIPNAVLMPYKIQSMLFINKKSRISSARYTKYKTQSLYIKILKVKYKMPSENSIKQYQYLS